MRLLRLRPAALAVLALAAATLPATDLVTGPPYKATELFPAAPSVNAQRGYAVAVDGDRLAMGAHLEGDHDAGAVYLFEWSGTTWEQTDKLLAGPPGAQLGFSLALRGNVLAAGAPGEGAVYVFVKQVGGWVLQKRLTGKSHGARSFGRSLALGGGRLAVGAFGAHGGTAGAVYLYGVSTWDFRKIIRPQAPQEGERFGSAVALEGKLLAVGAPGRDLGPHREAADAGAVYLFEAGTWKQKPLLSLESAASSPGALAELAGDQLGFAVALADGEIAAGAPTADVRGGNSGAVYVFAQQDGRWGSGSLVEAPQVGEHDQLGYSLALSGDLLVVGAPAPPPGDGTGGIHVFRRAGASWVEQAVAPLVPGNSEVRDLSGFAVAISGERVAVGGVLGDQGDSAAGAAWSFRCPAPDACMEEAEALARDDPMAVQFGVSVAVTENYLAIGSPRKDGVHGAVYIYRKAGNGWRQEARLTSDDPLDGFGSSVALDEERLRLAVGAPKGFHGGNHNGVVFLYSRQGGSWELEEPFDPKLPALGEVFGTSVAIVGDALAIGAPRGIDPGAVYVAEKIGKEWIQPGSLTFGSPSNAFGASVSLSNGVLAIGAPGENGKVGAVYLAVRDPQKWVLLPQKLEGAASSRFGSSVSVAKGMLGMLAVGAPGSNGGIGAAYLFEETGGGRAWQEVPLPLPTISEAHSLGASVALSPRADWLAVGAQDSDGSGRAFLFDRNSQVWTEILALKPQKDDGFGSSVALSSGFAVATSPGNKRGDRITVFTLPRENR